MNTTPETTPQAPPKRTMLSKAAIIITFVILIVGGLYISLTQGVQAKVRQADAVRDQMYYHINQAKELKEQAAEQEKLALEEGEKLNDIKKELPVSLCLEDPKNCPQDFL